MEFKRKRKPQNKTKNKTESIQQYGKSKNKSTNSKILFDNDGNTMMDSSDDENSRGSKKNTYNQSKFTNDTNLGARWYEEVGIHTFS